MIRTNKGTESPALSCPRKGSLQKPEKLKINAVNLRALSILMKNVEY